MIHGTGLRRVENGVVIAALAAMIALPLLEAGNRLFGLPSLPGLAAYVRHLVLWLTFGGALLATREERHLALATAQLLRDGAIRSAVRVLSHAVAAAACGVLAYAAAQVVLVNRLSASRFPWGLPEWPSEAVMPVALALMALRLVLRASTGWRGRTIALAAVGAAFALGLLSDPGDATTILGSRTFWRWPVVALIGVSAFAGTPIFALMASLAAILFFTDGTPVAAVSSEVYRLVGSPALPAIPLLTAAGFVLAESRASERLLRLFLALFGWLPGGLAVMVTLVCALFTTFTGGSGVTIIALGGLVLPILLKDRWPESFSVGLVTSSGSLGLLFPPSLPVVLYAVVTGSGDVGVPVESLFIAGFVPGLVMLGIVAGYGIVKGARLGMPRQSFSWRELGSAASGAKWEMALPAAVIGLFATGTTSMVETAAAAALMAIVVEVVILRDVSLGTALPNALVKSAVLAGAVLILLCAAMGTTSYLVDAQAPERILDWVRGHVESPLVFLLALNLFLIVVGCLADIYSAIVVVAPLVVPIGAAFGVDPVHLGVIFLANLELGYLTPPVGLNLFLSSARFGRPLLQVFRDTWPFLVILAIGVLTITYVPAISIGVLALRGG